MFIIIFAIQSSNLSHDDDRDVMVMGLGVVFTVRYLYQQHSVRFFHSFFNPRVYEIYLEQKNIAIIHKLRKVVGNCIELHALQ
jgi:hypothetical protein